MVNENIVGCFDIETLNTSPSGVILSLGIVFFDLTKVQSFDELVSQGVNLYFDQEDQIARGRTKSQDTLDWWARQGEGASECLNNPNQFNGARLFEALNQLYTRIGFRPHPKQTRWFSRGHFDIAFMDNFCETYEIAPMIKYWCWRDVRSFLDGKGIGSQNQKFNKPSSMIPHNSHHDAAFDAYMMQRMINWTPEQIAEELDGERQDEKRAANA